MKTLMLMVVLGAQMAFAASGTVIRSEQLPAEARVRYERAIAAAKKATPEVFEQVAAFRSGLATLDANKRGRLAAVGPRLKDMPEGGVWALVESAAFAGEVEDGLKPSALLAWHAGLLEALGSKREPALKALYVTVLSSDTRFEVARAAAAALGKLSDDGAVDTLVKLARGQGISAKAAQLGLGDCRRLKASQALGQALASSTELEHRLDLIRALARLGSPWAWATPAGAPPHAEAAGIRRALADALVPVYLKRQGDERQHAFDALVELSAPETVVLLSAQRAVDPVAVDTLMKALKK